MKRIARQLIEGNSYEPSNNYTGIDVSVPYVVYESSLGIPSGYEDVTTSIKDVTDFYVQAGADYITMRDMCKQITAISGGFNSLSVEDQELAKEHIAIDETDVAEKTALVIYLLLNEAEPVDPLNPTAQEMIDAQSLYAEYKAIQINNTSVAAHERAYLNGAISPELLKIVMSHVVEAEMKDLLNNVEAFLPDYTTIGWFGTIYGDPSVGLADYINKYGNYAPDSGLWTFATNAPSGSDQATIDAYKTARQTTFDEYLFK